VSSEHIDLFAYTNCAHSPTVEDAWKHPRHRQAEGYTDVAFWESLGRLLERGGFAGLFFADAWNVTDSYGGSVDAAIRRGEQVPENDPLPLLAAIASATDDLGLIATASTSFYPPYLLAKKLSTIDHLTDGRLGWNVVTSSGEMEFRNMDVDYVPHDERYDVADEFMEVCYRLWEGSWEDGAVRMDATADAFADPDRVHRIDFEGEYFELPGPHLCAPSPQRTPTLFQAGQSDRGRAFAATHAEAAFVRAVDPEGFASAVADVRERARSVGRDPDSIRIYPGVAPYVAATESAARERFERVRDEVVSVETGLVRLSNHLDHDYSQYDPDEPLRAIETDAIRGVLELFLADDREWTVREAAIEYSFGGREEFVGTPATVADEMERWIEAGADGFLIRGHLVPATFADAVDHLVPELRRRGLLPPAEADPGSRPPTGRGRTLRDRLTGDGPRLPADHPGRAAVDRVRFPND
jgi:FMN-dependent oxidoreductase (nitrilotriacetate monooxygenase family)